MSQETELSYREIPILPLRGLLVFPYTVIHLDVGRKKINKCHRRGHAWFEGNIFGHAKRSSD